jgi:hypothetical protein
LDQRREELPGDLGVSGDQGQQEGHDLVVTQSVHRLVEAFWIERASLTR